MALTESEESKLRTIISAFENGQQIDDLAIASAAVQDKEIEVFDKVTGASGRMGLRDAVQMANAPYFARYWNMDSATPTAAGWEGSLEFGQNLPDELGLGCYLVKNDHSRRKLDPTNHYRFATGETAKLDGSMGHYQWGWGKTFYIAFWQQARRFYVAVSLSPIAGKWNYRIPVGSMSASGHACMERSTTTLVSYINDDPNYRGGDNSTSYDGTPKTLCGRAVTSITTETARAAARRNGSGWLAGTMRHSAVVKVLFEVIFGTRNVQAAYNSNRDANGLYQGGLGSGVTNLSWGTWGDYNGYRPFLHTSAGVELADSCGIANTEVKDADGNVIYTAPVPVFFGLKNMHGYLWRIQDDEFGKCNADGSITHLVAPSIYGEWTCGVETGMKAYSTTPPTGEGYIKSMAYDKLEMFPTATGGSESTYMCDYFWNTSGATSGFRLVLRGCRADDGSRSGASGVSVGGAVSSSNVDFGAPLCEAVEEWTVEPEYAEVA